MFYNVSGREGRSNTENPEMQSTTVKNKSEKSHSKTVFDSNFLWHWTCEKYRAPAITAALSFHNFGR